MCSSPEGGYARDRTRNDHRRHGLSVQSRRNIDPFFGGGHEVSRSAARVQTPRVNIHIPSSLRALRPAFCAAVGNPSMEASLSARPTGGQLGREGSFHGENHGTGQPAFSPAPKLTLPPRSAIQKINHRIHPNSNFNNLRLPATRYCRSSGARGRTCRIDFDPFHLLDPEHQESLTLSSQTFPAAKSAPNTTAERAT